MDNTSPYFASQDMNYCNDAMYRAPPQMPSHDAPLSSKLAAKVKEEPGEWYDNTVKSEPAVKKEKPVKKKKDRFNGMSEEEILKRTIPDHLTPDLDIVIIGINPGLTAAYVGHHYAGPGNHFWKCLYMAGMIPEPMNAYDDYKLVEFGIGFTNIVGRATRGSGDLTKREIKDGGDLLKLKIKEFQPRIAVFNGKGIYEIFCGHKNFHIGKQPDPFPGTDSVYTFVMPSSSARCSQLPRAIDKVPFYVALKKLRDHIRGDLKELDESEVRFPDLELKVEPRKNKDDVMDNGGSKSKKKNRKRKVTDDRIEGNPSMCGVTDYGSWAGTATYGMMPMKQEVGVVPYCHYGNTLSTSFSQMHGGCGQMPMAGGYPMMPSPQCGGVVSQMGYSTTAPNMSGCGTGNYPGCGMDQGVLNMGPLSPPQQHPQVQSQCVALDPVPMSYPSSPYQYNMPSNNSPQEQPLSNGIMVPTSSQQQQHAVSTQSCIVNTNQPSYLQCQGYDYNSQQNSYSSLPASAVADNCLTSYHSQQPGPGHTQYTSFQFQDL